MNYNDIVYNLFFIVIVLFIWKIHGTPFKFPKLEHANPGRSFVPWAGASQLEATHGAGRVRIAGGGPRPPCLPVRACPARQFAPPGLAWSRRRSSSSKMPPPGVDPDGRAHPALDRPERARAWGAASWRGSRPREARAGRPVGS